MKHFATVALALLGLLTAPLTQSADKIGIFEKVFESSVSFADTLNMLESALAESDLILHGSHVIRVPDGKHQAKIFVLTSPTYADAAASESPRTISAQILRVAVFTWGDEQRTMINMANPVAHAMIYYSKSSNYESLVLAARQAAEEIRQLVSAVPGNVVSIEAKPFRNEKHYRKYKGDGPARMMAKFRTWQKSQLVIEKDTSSNFDAVVEKISAALTTGVIADASESKGWEKIAQIRLRDDVVYFGITNPFIEDKMVRINSRFRNTGKSDRAPYPGVDHLSALPTEVLVVKDGDETLVLHYGQMWRMQLYFWDSGYRAFTANVGVPGEIAKSIDRALTTPED